MKDKHKWLLIYKLAFCFLNDVLHHKGIDNVWLHDIPNVKKRKMFEAHNMIPNVHDADNDTLGRFYRGDLL